MLPIHIELPDQTRTDAYRVTVEQYSAFKRDGFLVVKNLVPLDHIDELRRHTDELMQGQLPEQQQPVIGNVRVLEAPPSHLSPEEKASFFLRIHMLHRVLALHERYMLHARVLDMLEVLIGPDLLALQTMLFLKPPGKPGQGWHQDSFYIPTHPDTLCGAWIAIDECDEFNGGLWMAKGSGTEPVYPPKTGYGYGERSIAGIHHVEGVSDTDDSKNDLSRVANKYDQVVVHAYPGDVVFFNGHVLHRSKQNVTTSRFRRSFVSHYCNARSFTQWGADGGFADGGVDAANCQDPLTKMTNGSHILARGDTHLPFALPRFGTPCAALLPAEVRRRYSDQVMAAMGDMDGGAMEAVPARSDVQHDDHDDEDEEVQGAAGVPKSAARA